MSTHSTADLVVAERLSMARFGDGEMMLMCGQPIGFQEYDPDLSERLESVLRSRDPRLLVCVPGVFGGLKNFTPRARRVWQEIMGTNRSRWLTRLPPEARFGDSLITRFWVDRGDPAPHVAAFRRLTEVWRDRDVIVVEGLNTNLGAGNDLLSTVRSTRRVLCPTRNAFSRYDDILTCVSSQPKDVLVLIALGPTATVLAADLAKLGYQALDIGHLDIEYEWLLKGATSKQAVPGKWVNEVGDQVGGGMPARGPWEAVGADILADLSATR